MDVRDVVAHVRPKFPWVLSRPRFGFGAVGIENGIRRIKKPFESGTFFQKLQRVLPAHATVVHAIFVKRLDARVKKHLRHVAARGGKLQREFCARRHPA